MLLVPPPITSIWKKGEKKGAKIHFSMQQCHLFHTPLTELCSSILLNQIVSVQHANLSFPRSGCSVINNNIVNANNLASGC